MMNRTYRINSGKFILHWVGWWLVIWLVAVVVAIPLSVVAYIVGSLASSSLYPTILFIPDVVVGIGAGIALGHVVGRVQQRMIMRHLYWDVAGWGRRSFVGGILGGILVALTLTGLHAVRVMLVNFGRAYGYHTVTDLLQNVQYLVEVLPIAVFVVVVSAAQWTLLRHFVRSAWLWVLANVVGAWVFAALFINADAAMTSWFLAVAAQGLVTGFTLLWLFQRLPHHEESPNPTPSSVWDHAV